MTDYNLTHLKQLEAESIHIIREVAAEFEKPRLYAPARGISSLRPTSAVAQGDVGFLFPRAPYNAPTLHGCRTTDGR